MLLVRLNAQQVGLQEKLQGAVFYMLRQDQSLKWNEATVPGTGNQDHEISNQIAYKLIHIFIPFLVQLGSHYKYFSFYALLRIQ